MNPIRRRRLGGNPYPNIAAQFVGASSQSASITDNASLSGGAVDLSIACWVRVTSVASAQTLVSKWNGTGNQREYDLEVNTSGVSFVISADGLGGGSLSTATTTTFGVLTANVWYFLCGRLDNTNNLLKISVNAGTVDSVACTTDIFDGTADFRLGSLASNLQFLTGNLDCVGVWKSALGGGGFLSDAQVTALYNNGVGMARRDLAGNLLTGLISYWNLDGNLVDSAGTNSLTNNNGVSFVPGKR